MGNLSKMKEVVAAKRAAKAEELKDKMRAAAKGTVFRPPLPEAVSGPGVKVASDATPAAGGVASSWRPGRTAKARGGRAAARGRLPIGAVISQNWDGESWACVLSVPAWGVSDGSAVWSRRQSGTNLWQCLEDLDVAFWNWFATASDQETRRLAFAGTPPAAAPGACPTPASSAGTGSTHPA